MDSEAALGADGLRAALEAFFSCFLAVSGRLRVWPMRMRYTIFGTGRGLRPMDSEAALGAGWILRLHLGPMV